MLSQVQPFATLWTVAHQAPLSMEFSRQDYWGGLSFPSPGDLPNPAIKLRSLELQADSLLSKPSWKSKILIVESKSLKKEVSVFMDWKTQYCYDSNYSQLL